MKGVMIMFKVYAWLIALVILGCQYYLLRRRNVWWGAVLPAAYFLVFIYGWVSETYFTRENSTSFILALLGGLAFLLSGWINGRESVKRKEKKELDKMKLKDIK